LILCPLSESKQRKLYHHDFVIGFWKTRKALLMMAKVFDLISFGLRRLWSPNRISLAFLESLRFGTDYQGNLL